MVHTASVAAWAGYAFENICFKHIYQIRCALGMEKIGCRAGRWAYRPKKGASEQGVQIDLLFDRVDGIVTVCEIKYSEHPFIIDKDYGKRLMKKLEVFQEQTKSIKQILLAMITTMGVKSNLWSEELVQNEVTLKDLFIY